MAEERVEVRIDVNSKDAQVAIQNLAKEVGLFTVGINEAVQIAKQMLGAVIDFGKESFEAFVQQEKAAARLGAVLEATGGAAGYSKEQLVDMASAMQAVTTYGDEVVIEAQAILATFRNISGETFPQTIRLAGDLAATFGIDLATATRMLGKALDDPANGMESLQRIGIRLSETQKEQIKQFQELGDRASAQAVILKELEGRVGGVAEKMAQTAGGAMEQMKNAIGDLKEAFGELIAKATEPVIRKITEWATALTKGIQASKLVEEAVKMQRNEIERLTTTELQKYVDALKAKINATRQMIEADASGLLQIGRMGDELNKLVQTYERLNSVLSEKRRIESTAAVSQAIRPSVAVSSKSEEDRAKSEMAEWSYQVKLAEMERNLKAIEQIGRYLAVGGISTWYVPAEADISAVDQMNDKLGEMIKQQSRLAQTAQEAENMVLGWVPVSKDAREEFVLLINLQRELNEGFVRIGAMAFVDQMRELGAAAYDAGLSLTTLGNAIAGMGLQILDMLPQLFLQAGLTQIIAGNVGLGLALIAMAGTAAAVGGYAREAVKEETAPKATTNVNNNTIVKVENNTNTPATYTESTAPDGTKIVEVIVGQVAGAIMSGELDGAMNARYGARPKGVVR